MDFKQEVEARIKANESDKALRSSREAFVKASMAVQYSYNFTWLGRPIIQYPQDMVAMQEILWQVQPDLIGPLLVLGIEWKIVVAYSGWTFLGLSVADSMHIAADGGRRQLEHRE